MWVGGIIMYKLKLSDYNITEKGEVINVKNGRVLKPQLNGKGYLRVSISGKLEFIHRLVAEKYIPNPNNLPQVNHKDGNKLNNKVENLEWSTNRDNRQHALANNLHVCGEKCTWSKLTEENVRFIRANKNVSAKELAKKFNVSVSTIKDVINNRTWKQLKSYAELSQNEVIEARDKKLLR